VRGGASLRAVRGAACLAVLAACSGNRPAPSPEPAPAPVVAPVPAAAPMAPARAAGTYALQAVIQGRTIPAPAAAARPRARAAATPPAATLVLAARPPAALESTAPSTTQFAATVALPGYTMAPRGRMAQSGAWWPTVGDSVVVYWVTPRNAGIALKGTLRGDTLSGDVWYTSLESGSEFQLGTFTAVRRRAAR